MKVFEKSRKPLAFVLVLALLFGACPVRAFAAVPDNPNSGVALESFNADSNAAIAEVIGKLGESSNVAIKLTTDVAVTGQIVIPTNTAVVLDLNGYILNGLACTDSELFVVNGWLSVIDANHQAGLEKGIDFYYDEDIRRGNQSSYRGYDFITSYDVIADGGCIFVADYGFTVNDGGVLSVSDAELYSRKYYASDIGDEEEEEFKGNAFTLFEGAVAELNRLKIYGFNKGYKDFYNGNKLYGGAIYNKGTVTLNDCIISRCGGEFTEDGGAIYNDGVMTINGGEFSDCYCFSDDRDGSFGNVVYNGYSAEMNINGTKFYSTLLNGLGDYQHTIHEDDDDEPDVYIQDLFKYGDIVYYAVLYNGGVLRLSGDVRMFDLGNEMIPGIYSNSVSPIEVVGSLGTRNAYTAIPSICLSSHNSGVVYREGATFHSYDFGTSLLEKQILRLVSVEGSDRLYDLVDDPAGNEYDAQVDDIILDGNGNTDIKTSARVTDLREGFTARIQAYLSLFSQAAKIAGNPSDVIYDGREINVGDAYFSKQLNGALDYLRRGGIEGKSDDLMETACFASGLVQLLLGMTDLDYGDADEDSDWIWADESCFFFKSSRANVAYCFRESGSEVYYFAKELLKQKTYSADARSKIFFEDLYEYTYDDDYLLITEDNIIKSGTAAAADFYAEGFDKGFADLVNSAERKAPELYNLVVGIFTRDNVFTIARDGKSAELLRGAISASFDENDDLGATVSVGKLLGALLDDIALLYDELTDYLFNFTENNRSQKYISDYTVAMYPEAINGKIERRSVKGVAVSSAAITEALDEGISDVNDILSIAIDVVEEGKFLTAAEARRLGVSVSGNALRTNYEDVYILPIHFEDVIDLNCLNELISEGAAYATEFLGIILRGVIDDDFEISLYDDDGYYINLLDSENREDLEHTVLNAGLPFAAALFGAVIVKASPAAADFPDDNIFTMDEVAFSFDSLIANYGVWGVGLLDDEDEGVFEMDGILDELDDIIPNIIVLPSTKTDAGEVIVNEDNSVRIVTDAALYKMLSKYDGSVNSYAEYWSTDDKDNKSKSETGIVGILPSGVYGYRYVVEFNGESHISKVGYFNVPFADDNSNTAYVINGTTAAVYTARLVKGDVPYAEATTFACISTGEAFNVYGGSFSNQIPAGRYNLIVSDDKGAQIVKMVTIDGNRRVTADSSLVFDMPRYDGSGTETKDKIEIIVNAPEMNNIDSNSDENSVNIVVGGLEALANELRSIAADEGTVFDESVLSLRVSKKEVSGNETAGTPVYKLLAAPGAAGNYESVILDINIKMSFVDSQDSDNNESQKITNIKDATNGRISHLDIYVPFDTSKEIAGVYRYHDGRVEALGIGPGNANADGEYCEILTGEIHLHVQKFSLYSISYLSSAPGPASYDSSWMFKELARQKAEAEKKKGKELPFTDIAKGTELYDAVSWAYWNGYTNGISATLFGPKDTIQRDQIITFLYRAAGSPNAGNPGKYGGTVKYPDEVKASLDAGKTADEIAALCPFTDITKGSWNYDAIVWAWSVGVTNGTSRTTFSPKLDCSEGMIKDFLNRFAGETTGFWATDKDDCTREYTVLMMYKKFAE